MDSASLPEMVLSTHIIYNSVTNVNIVDKHLKLAVN